MIKHLLSVLMDSIRDAEMLMDYSSDALKAGDNNMASWFLNHAKMRVDQLDADYEFVCRSAGLAERVRSGDDIAEALMDHVESQIDALKSKLR